MADNATVGQTVAPLVKYTKCYILKILLSTRRLPSDYNIVWNERIKI